MKKSSIVLIVIIAIAIAMIVVIYVDSSTYSTFAEAREKKTELYVSGVLNKAKAVDYDPVKDPNRFSFFMYDSDSAECLVVFRGAKPQDFERAETIVLTGKMDGDVFLASKILMKCPSKYNQDEVEVTEIPASAYSGFVPQ